MLIQNRANTPISFANRWVKSSRSVPKILRRSNMPLSDTAT